MDSGSFRFDRFRLDPGNRRLSDGDRPVELNARYFDALGLLVREQGRLVTKDRFLDEVWRGVPVTDEALTQCIKTLRRALGDDAARPRFIETVPKHGYRFIAAVEEGGATVVRPVVTEAQNHFWKRLLLLGAAGTLGGGVAGVIGGLFYGFAAAAQAMAPAIGAVSVLLVLLWLTALMALLGAAGVAFGIAATERGSRPGPWAILGGATGGLVVGAIVKLLGIDAFSLLFGQSPGEITGAMEGALLGAGVGLGAWLADRGPQVRSLRRRIAIAGVTGAAAGILIPLLGGRLMGGSLDLLARHFPNSRLRLDEIGGLFGESSFGPISQVVTGALEGALFSACIVGAMVLARQRLRLLDPPRGGEGAAAG